MSTQRQDETVSFRVVVRAERSGSRVSILVGLGHASFADQVSRATICSLGQPDKAIVPFATANESPIEPWLALSPPVACAAHSRRTT